MTEEIIKLITEAENKAAEIRRLAEERAADILAQAQLQADRSKQSSEDVCKAYRETQIKLAHEDAEKQYAETIAIKTRDSQKYCAQIMQEKSEKAISEIVGRITSGNC